MYRFLVDYIQFSWLTIEIMYINIQLMFLKLVASVRKPIDAEHNKAKSLSTCMLAPTEPLVAEQWQAEDQWSIINRWVCADVIDAAWRCKVVLPRHLLLWSVASDIITYPAGAPMSPLGRELSELTRRSHLAKTHTGNCAHVIFHSRCILRFT